MSKETKYTVMLRQEDVESMINGRSISKQVDENTCIVIRQSPSKDVTVNSFCADGDCINHYEDMCILAVNNEDLEISPETRFCFGRESGKCKQFVAGSFIAYILDGYAEE